MEANKLAKEVLKKLFMEELNSGATKKDLMIFDCPGCKFSDFPQLHALYIDYCIKRRELVDLAEFQKCIFEKLKDEKIKEIYLRALVNQITESNKDSREK